MPETFPAEPFYLKSGIGRRFCLYHAPSPDKTGLGSFIYVHPFGDEMNKSRRMAAMQARAFAEAGFGVLQIDLFGCGDSEGEFGDARWAIWKQDLAFAWGWLENRASNPISLWGLRLGALLALDFASSWEKPIDKIVLWQPVIDGSSFLNQFLRLRMANEMLAGAVGSKKAAGTGALRNCLANGKMLEVAGYELAPELAAAIDTLKAAERVVSGCPLYWFEVVAESGRSMTPAATKVVDRWRRDGTNPHVHLVPCLPFWATQEISECSELISATVNILAEAVS